MIANRGSTGCPQPVRAIARKKPLTSEITCERTILNQ